VEDDPLFTRLIEQSLQELDGGWQMRWAHTAKDALGLIDGGELHWVDLVLVDLGLPDIHGVEVIRKAHLRWPQVPVLVSSVHRGGPDVLAAIEAGARGYVDKGDTAMTLARAIETVLRGEYPISASLAQHLFRLVPAPEADTADRSDEILSNRELELLRLLGDGYTYEEASHRMNVSLNTVQTYSRRIFQKLEVRSKVQAISTAQSLGLL
jgi:DNA-binding NarL/FixJ family response regulator